MKILLERDGVRFFPTKRKWILPQKEKNICERNRRVKVEKILLGQK